MKLVLVFIWGPICGKCIAGCKESAIVPFEREMVISFRLCTVTTVLSLTIRSQFAIECLRRSNQHGWATFGRKRLTDVRQIIM